jgi:uncharacterized membrane protein
MKERWLPVGVLAAVLFAVNALGRVVVKFVASGQQATKQTGIGLVAIIAVGVVMIAAAYWWARRHPMPRVLADLVTAVVAACLLSVLVGPFVVGSHPMAEGVGLFIREIGVYLAFAAGGTLFGLLAVMTAGQDWKSQAWKRYAEQARARPRRAVRR